ncbi:hypothetical protein [Dictyobacter kobayashii]|uniref:Uncharacterized protein n=1 Tax=Dictyobacter kobayashii TaxID=2014872 RepID=A0A402AU52_9CHLR|nr:hypothetical protein [Dictyobacter kobayashii]GCE22652.1 hypothetical protein KDK_64520 [Dictyobacter kobayashii]
MNIDLVAITKILLEDKHSLYTLILLTLVLGSFYSAPNIFGRKRSILEKMTQSILTGGIGGLAGSICLDLGLLPLVLLFRPALYKQINATRNLNPFTFLKLLFLSINVTNLINIAKELLIYVFVGGILLGFFIGLINAVLFKPAPTQSLQKGNSKKTASASNHFLGWCAIGTGLGLAVGLLLGPFIGTIAGLLAGSIGYLLKLSPKKPLATSSIFKKIGDQLSWPTILFWIIAAIPFPLLFIYCIKIIFLQPLYWGPFSSLFLSCIVILFFVLLKMRLKQLGLYKVKAKKNLNQDWRFKIDHKYLLKAFNTGIICGILLYGIAYGALMSIYFATIFGVGIGIVIEIIFMLAGLGFGVMCGVIFIYIYIIGPIIAFKMSFIKDDDINQIGFWLMLISGIISTLLLWSS